MAIIQNQTQEKNRRQDTAETLGPVLGRLAGPEELGRAGSDFIAYMVQAAQEYFIQQAVSAVKAGFQQGLTEGDADAPDTNH